MHVRVLSICIAVALAMLPFASDAQTSSCSPGKTCVSNKFESTQSAGIGVRIRNGSCLRIDGAATGSLPACGSDLAGGIIYDTTNQRIKWCNGTSWADVGSSSTTVCASSDGDATNPSILWCSGGNSGGFDGFFRLSGIPDIIGITTDGIERMRISSAGIRVPNNQWLLSRNAANNADIDILRLDTNNRIQAGDSIHLPNDRAIAHATLNATTYMGFSSTSGQVAISGGSSSTPNVMIGAYQDISAANPAIRFTDGAFANTLVDIRGDGSIVSNGTVTVATPIGLSSGGTAKNLTAVNGGIVWTDTDSLEVIAAGNSGEYLRSNGAAAPSWTTAPTTTWRAQAHGWCGSTCDAVNVLGAFRPDRDGLNIQNIVTVIGSVGSGGTTGMDIRIRVAGAGATVCTATFNCQSSAVQTVTCSGAISTGTTYEIVKLTDDCTVDSTNLVVNVSYGN